MSKDNIGVWTQHYIKINVSIYVSIEEHHCVSRVIDTCVPTIYGQSITIRTCEYIKSTSLIGYI